MQASPLLAEAWSGFADAITRLARLEAPVRRQQLEELQTSLPSAVEASFKALSVGEAARMGRTWLDQVQEYAIGFVQDMAESLPAWCDKVLKDKLPAVRTTLQLATCLLRPAMPIFLLNETGVATDVIEIDSEEEDGGAGAGAGVGASAGAPATRTRSRRGGAADSSDARQRTLRLLGDRELSLAAALVAAAVSAGEPGFNEVVKLTEAAANAHKRGGQDLRVAGHRPVRHLYHTTAAGCCFREHDGGRQHEQLSADRHAGICSICVVCVVD